LGVRWRLKVRDVKGRHCVLAKHCPHPCSLTFSLRLHRNAFDPAPQSQ
jgi:hypothetical protein